MATNHHDGSGHSPEHAAGSKKGNVMAIFAYLGILIIIPFLTKDKDDEFVKFHLKQGLALIIFGLIGWLIAAVIGWLPIIGWLIVWIWWIIYLILVIIGILNVLNGQEKQLPIVGQYGAKFTF